MDSRARTSADRTRHAPLPVLRSQEGRGVTGGGGADKVFDKMRHSSRDTKARRGTGAPALSVGGPPGGHPRRRGRPPPPRRGPRQAALRLPRVARRGAPPPPPPLPLLVLVDFSFASFCAGGTLTGVRRRVPVLERETASAGSVRCVGSFEGWLVGVKVNRGRYFGDLRCFLMKAFSRDVIRLPPPSAAARPMDAYSRSLPIVNGSGMVN
ncbi:unnamed protein product [Urochloa humidicola]